MNVINNCKSNRSERNTGCPYPNTITLVLQGEHSVFFLKCCVSFKPNAIGSTPYKNSSSAYVVFSTGQAVGLGVTGKTTLNVDKS